MADIEIDEDQHEYLNQLRTELADEHVGDYGYVRYRDALQYLIDHYDSVDSEVATGAEEEQIEQGGAEESAGEDADDETGDETEADETGDETEADDSGSASRLERMMGLLDDHDDVWEQNDGEDGRYAVTLPDGSTEQVRTKDDVRALLFQYYD
jgi:hypothetical protein